MKKQKVFDLQFKVHKLSVENKLLDLDVGGPGLLVAACQQGTRAVITIWSVGSSQQITYKCQLDFSTFGLDFTGEGHVVHVDLNNISVFLWKDQETLYTIHLISTTTLISERSLSTRGYMPSFYMNGILALSNEKDCIW